MGELHDKLSASDRGADAFTKSALDQAIDFFLAASQKVNEAAGAVRKPGMPWTKSVDGRGKCPCKHSP